MACWRHRWNRCRQMFVVIQAIEGGIRQHRRLQSKADVSENPDLHRREREGDDDSHRRLPGPLRIGNKRTDNQRET